MDVRDIATKQDIQELRELILNGNREDKEGPANYDSRQAMSRLNIKRNTFTKLEEKGVIKGGFYPYCNKKLYPVQHIEDVARLIETYANEL